MKYEILVDFDVCDSFGACVVAAPGVFDLNDDDEVVVLREVEEADKPAVEDAVARCPKRAIALREITS